MLAAHVGVRLRLTPTYVFVARYGFDVDNKDVILMTWQISYYSAKVAAQIEDWPAGVRASFLRITETMVELGPDIGMPHTRAMGAGLFEVRAKGREGIGRAFYCTVVGRRIVILHAIIKKTEKTPVHDVEIARTRLKEAKTWHANNTNP
jgi:phage-related protein